MKKKSLVRLLATAAASLSWGGADPVSSSHMTTLAVRERAVAAGTVYLLVIVLSKQTQNAVFRSTQLCSVLIKANQPPSPLRHRNFLFTLFGLIIKYWLIFPAGVNNAAQHQEYWRRHNPPSASRFRKSKER